MMTNQNKVAEIDTSRHEQEYQLKRDDTLDIALLVNVVGSELTKVDKHAVDGSFKKATKIDKQKIFSQQPISPPLSVVNNTQELKRVEPPSPVQVPTPPKTPTPVAQTISPSVDLSPVLQKLESLEKKMLSLQSTYDTILNKLTKATKQVTLTIDNDKS